MATTKENLTEEIIANARRDRKRLEAVADGLVTGFAKVPDETDGGENQEFDPEIAAAFAEEIAKIGDSLTKVNQQLVELVKIEQKKYQDDNPVKLGSKEVQDVYDQIQPQEVN